MARHISLAIGVLAMVLLAIHLPLQDWLTALFDWSQPSPNLVALAFSGLIVLAMVLILPVSVSAMAAGFIFGLSKGFWSSVWLD